MFSVALLSLLPKKYRSALTPDEVPARGAIISGIAEMLAGVGLLIHGYGIFAQSQLASVPSSVLLAAGKQGGESAIMGLGSIYLVGYIFQPLSLALLFVTAEGGCRMIAALATGETLPIFPFYLMSLLHTGFGSWHRESQMGRRIRDDVQYMKGEFLQISSCRPKPWNGLTTIAYDSVLYEVDSVKQSSVPRRFVYVLRRKPAGGIVRGLHRYSPDEVLTAHR
jgi:hypothetical protein